MLQNAKQRGIPSSGYSPLCGPTCSHWTQRDLAGLFPVWYQPDSAQLGGKGLMHTCRWMQSGGTPDTVYTCWLNCWLRGLTADFYDIQGRGELLIFVQLWVVLKTKVTSHWSRRDRIEAAEVSRVGGKRLFFCDNQYFSVKIAATFYFFIILKLNRSLLF